MTKNDVSSTCGNDAESASQEQVKPAHVLAHKDGICEAAFSPDSRYLMTSSWDKVVKLWEVRTGKELLSLDTEDVVESI